MKYLKDGSPISSSVPHSPRRVDHKSLYGLYRGVIKQVIYPDDPNNLTKDRIEYIVKVGGQVYPNAINLREAGGGYNYRERIRKATEKSESGKLSESTFDELLDGEHVYVMFIEGNGNVPLIIGGAESPQRRRYKKFKKADGLFDIEEFNGIEFLIDKDSNYVIKHVGRKDKDGKILNEPAVNSVFTMSKDGDFELDTYGDSLTNRIKLTKADKKIEINSQANKIVLDASGIIAFDKNENKVTLDAVGVKVEDKNSNIVEMKGGAVTITVEGKATINSSGDTEVNAVNAKVNTSANCEVNAGADCKVDASANCNVTAGGNVVVTGSQIQLNGSTGSVLTTETEKFTDLITGVPTQGVATVKAG